MGPATSACRKLDVKSLPLNCTVFLMKPQERMVCPSAPLSKGPDGLEFWLQGTMLKVAPVSTKYLSFVSSSVRKMSPALAGKWIAVAVACAGLAANRKWSGGKLVFQPSTGWSTPVSPIGVVIVKFAHAIARVLKQMKIWAGGGATFGAGVTALFVASPPVVGSRAPTSLSCGGRDCRVIATSSIPQGIRGIHHGRGCRVVPHGRGKVNNKHGQEKIIVRRNTGWKML
jgi:hypothetical protein